MDDNLRTVAAQVLRDMEAQGVLLEWQTLLREALAAQPGQSLTMQMQQMCSDWGAYWRAPDAHGVDLTQEQALELLRFALGVEVEIKAQPPKA